MPVEVYIYIYILVARFVGWGIYVRSNVLVQGGGHRAPDHPRPTCGLQQIERVEGNSITQCLIAARVHNPAFS